jgi:acyl dehydratase
VEKLGSADEIKSAIGREMEPGDWMTITQDRVDGFADDTEDHQWIHVDPEKAASGPFGATIAHGFLTLSLLPHLLNSVRVLDNVVMGVNYGLEKVRFPTPVPVGGRVRARAVVADATDLIDGGLQMITRVTVELDGAPKPACVADLVTRAYFAPSP